MKEQLLWTSKTKVLLGSVEIMRSDRKNLISDVNFTARLYLFLFHIYHCIITLTPFVSINQSPVLMETNATCVILNIQQTLDI